MIRTDRAHLNTVALTHAGMTEKNNEDRYAITSFQLSENDKTPCLLAVVADGIGGHRAGEVASELAVNHITQVFAKSDGRHPRKTLESAIHEASEAIADHASSSDEHEGMGATCACIWVVGDKLYIATIGDTRIYLLRDDRIQQLTTDHTWIQEAIEKNIITPEQVEGHPNMHIIRRHLGSDELPEVDFRMRLDDNQSDSQAEDNQGMQILPGDTFLICSDGLTDLVWNDEIGKIISSNSSIKTAAEKLVETANQRGGHDNITTVLVSAPQDLRDTKSKLKTWLRR